LYNKFCYHSRETYERFGKISRKTSAVWRNIRRLMGNHQLNSVDIVRVAFPHAGRGNFDEFGVGM